MMDGSQQEGRAFKRQISLGHFVARLRADLRSPPREGQASTTEEEGDSVRLMSIHQAKGLEFPIVVVPDLNRKQDAPRKPVVFHHALGTLVRGASDVSDADVDDEEPSAGKSLGWLAYEAVERLEEDAESIRLFYVATTRARDSLILSAGCSAEAPVISTALRLLDERFDRTTGSLLKSLPDDWTTPSVRVIDAPPLSLDSQRRSRRRDLNAVAQVIESAAIAPVSSVILKPARPRFIDLNDLTGFPPRAARFARLVETILADPRALSPGSLAEVARLAGRRQDPSASAELVADAVRLLSPWLDGPLTKTGTIVERGLEWSLPWTHDDGTTIFHGRTEFLIRDSSRSLRVVTVRRPGSLGPLERLRCLLSARAITAMGLGTAAEGWRVTLGGDLRVEKDFSDAAIELAVEKVVATVTNGNSWLMSND